MDLPTGKSKSVRGQRPEYPIIDRDRFEHHQKFRKKQDCERIRFSKNSEDWVTWTAFALLRRNAAASWWPSLVGLARSYNSSLTLPIGWEARPEVGLWMQVRSPHAYERKSRDRMRLSNDPIWIARSQEPKAVEGESEIDITLRNNVLVAFLEAKLGSDISLRTTYDPDRNQIVRNVDCLLNEAGDREPVFWMIVRDADSSRRYTQLIERYRSYPNDLVQQLEHHPTERVLAVSRNLSLVLWRDLLREVINAVVDGDPEIDCAEVDAIKKELARRIA